MIANSNNTMMRDLIRQLTAGREHERAKAIKEIIKLIEQPSSLSARASETFDDDECNKLNQQQFFLLKGMQSITFALNATDISSPEDNDTDTNNNSDSNKTKNSFERRTNETLVEGTKLLMIISKKKKLRRKMIQSGGTNVVMLLMRIAKKINSVDDLSFYHCIKTIANLAQELTSNNSSMNNNINAHHHGHHEMHMDGNSGHNINHNNHNNNSNSSAQQRQQQTSFFPVNKESCELLVTCLMSKRLECSEAAVVALIHIARADNKKYTKLILNGGVCEPLVTLLQRSLLTQNNILLDYSAKLICSLSGTSLSGRHLLRNARAIDALTKALMRFKPSDDVTEPLIWAIASLCNNSDKSSMMTVNTEDTLVLAIGKDAIESIVKIANVHSNASAVARHRAMLTAYRLSSLLENKKYLQQHSKTTFTTLLETYARDNVSNNNNGENNITNKETSVLAFATIARIDDDKNYACELLKDNRLPIGKYIGTAVARWLGLRVVEKNDPARTLGVLDLLKLAAIIGRTAQTTKKTNPPSEAASAFCASGGAYVLCASLEPSEHSDDLDSKHNDYSDGENDDLENNNNNSNNSNNNNNNKNNFSSCRDDDDDDDTEEHQSSAAIVDACRSLSGLSVHPSHHSALRAANVPEELKAMLKTSTGRAGDPVPAMAQMFAKECLQRLVGANGLMSTDSAEFDVDRFLTRSLSTETNNFRRENTCTATDTTKLNKHPSSSSSSLGAKTISTPIKKSINGSNNSNNNNNNNNEMSESLLKTAASANVIDRMELGEHRVNQPLLSSSQQKKRFSLLNVQRNKKTGSRLFTRRRCIVLLCSFSVMFITFSLAGRLTEAIQMITARVSIGNF